MAQSDINSFFIFCLAGLGTRFTDVGIDCPKYLLPINDNKTTVLEESLASFKLSKNFKILLCCNQSHRQYEEKIKDILNCVNNDYEIIYTENTMGQAHTAYIASQYIDSKYYLDKPVLFFNGDTILKKRNLDGMILEMENSSGLIDCFTSQSDEFSYVKTSNENYISDIKEKICISDKATSGLYLFSSISIYLEAFETQRFLDSGSEIYISQVYKSMISRGKKIKCNLDVDINNTIILGTPKQYAQFLESNQ